MLDRKDGAGRFLYYSLCFTAVEDPAKPLPAVGLYNYEVNRVLLRIVPERGGGTYTVKHLTLYLRMSAPLAWDSIEALVSSSTL